jgi:DNA-binding NarL/FixJ family response regulator
MSALRGTHPSTSVYRERSHRDRLTRTEAKEVLTVDDYGAIRRARRDGMSIRQIARQFEHSRKTVRHVLSNPVSVHLFGQE